MKVKGHERIREGRAGTSWKQHAHAACLGMSGLHKVACEEAQCRMKTQIAASYKVRDPRRSRMVSVAVGMVIAVLVGLWLSGAWKRVDKVPSLGTATSAAATSAPSTATSVADAQKAAAENAVRDRQLAESVRKAEDGQRENDKLRSALDNTKAELARAQEEKTRLAEQTKREMEARAQQARSDEIARQLIADAKERERAAAQAKVVGELERRAAAGAKFRKTALSWIQASESNSPEDQLRLYADEVVFLDEGELTPAEIRPGLVKYQEQFVQRTVTLVGEPAMQLSADAQSAALRASYDYSYFDTKKNEWVFKRITNELAMQLKGDSARITAVGMPENIVVRREDFRGRRR